MAATKILHGPNQELMNDTRLELCPLALVERLGPVEIVYGRWDRIFGCWIYENGKPTRRHSPAPALLDKRGKLSLSEIPLCADIEELLAQFEEQGFEPPRHHLGEGIPGYSSTISPIIFRENELLDVNETVCDTYDFDTLEKFNTFIELIPGSVRRLAAQFGNNQWLILEAIWTRPQFERFVEQAVLDGSRGYISTCLISAGWQILNTEERRKLIDYVCSNKRRDVLSRLLNREVSNAALNAVSKLTDDEYDEQFWDELFHVLANPQKAKALAHANKLTPDTIRNLTALPGSLCLPEMISALDEFDLGGVLKAGLDIDLNELDDRILTRIRQILKNVRTSEDLDDRQDRIERVILEHAEFPPPPISGDRILQPLTSYEALVNEAKQMNNCVGNYADGVLHGHTYYFSWRGTERATVEITSEKNGAWTLTEHLGPENSQLSKKTSLEIMRSVLEGQTRSSHRRSASQASKK